MSRFQYDIVEVEETVSEEETGAETARPFLVRDEGPYGEDWVAQRVAKVVDFELSQGAMPA